MIGRTRITALGAVGLVALAACGSTGAGGAASGGSASPAGSAAAEGGAAGGSAFTAAPAAGSDAWKAPVQNCPSPADVTKKIKDTVTVGGTFPLTGPASAFAPFYTAFKAYVDYANTKDLLGGIKVTLRAEDDAYNPDKTPAATTKLINDGVDLTAGSIGTANQLAVRGTLNDQCIPQLLLAAGATEFGDVAHYPWTLAASLPYPYETEAYGAQIARDHPDGATLGLITVNNSAGQSYADGIDSNASKDRLTVVARQTLNPEDTSPPTAQVAAVAQKKPDVVVTAAVGAGCVTLLNSLAQAAATDPSWKPQVYVTSTCANSAILRSAGSAADNVRSGLTVYDVSNPDNANVAGVRTYLDAMKRIDQEKAAPAGTSGWFVGEALFGILQLAQKSPQGFSRASIMEAARNIQFRSTVSLPGVTNTSNGTQQPFFSQTIQISAFSAKSRNFSAVGDLYTAGR